MNLRLAVQSLTSSSGSKTIFNSSLTLCLVLTGDPVFNPGLVLLTLHTIVSNKAVSKSQISRHFSPAVWLLLTYDRPPRRSQIVLVSKITRYYQRHNHHHSVISQWKNQHYEGTDTIKLLKYLTNTHGRPHWGSQIVLVRYHHIIIINIREPYHKDYQNQHHDDDQVPSSAVN